MGRSRRDCPLCSTRSLLRLDHHLESVHGLTGEDKKKWLKPGGQPVEDIRQEYSALNEKGDKLAQAPTLKNVVNQLPFWDVNRVLFTEGIHLF